MTYFGKSAMALAVSLQFFSAAASAQLLFNPSFELGGSSVACGAGSAGAVTVTGTLGNNWSENSCWITTPSTITYALDNTTAHAGSVSQSIHSTGGVGQFYTALTLAPGNRYVVSIWLKADQPMTVRLVIGGQQPPYTSYGNLVANVTTSWKQFTLEGYAPATPAVAGGLYVILQQPGKLWLDNASATAVADATVDTIRTDVVPKTYFGMHIHRDPTWPTVEETIGSDRMWDGEGVQWADIFPTNPALGIPANWTKFNARVNAALLKKAEPVMVLGGNIPNWASSDPSGSHPDSNAYGPGTTAPPVNEEVWKAWVTAVAQEAKGRVKYWEIWNEPYYHAAFRNDIPRLVRLAQLAYPILKSIDPENKVLSPSFDAYDNSVLEKYLQAGGGAYMDIVSIHAYDFFGGNLMDLRVPAASRTGDPAGPEAMYYKEHLIRNTKLVLARYGQGSKQVWNTEGGYHAYTAAGAPNDALGAPIVARNLILGWALGGVDRNFFYSWDHHERIAGGRQATSNATVYTKTAVGRAFEQVSTWLTGSAMVSKTVDANGTWTIMLNPGWGFAKRFIVWNPNGSYPYAVPSTWTDFVLQQTNLDGVKTAIPSGFQATPSPVLLTRF